MLSVCILAELCRNYVEIILFKLMLDKRREEFDRCPQASHSLAHLTNRPVVQSPLVHS